MMERAKLSLLEGLLTLKEREEDFIRCKGRDLRFSYLHGRFNLPVNTTLIFPLVLLSPFLR
jgi:hypothetical protein